MRKLKTPKPTSPALAHSWHARRSIRAVHPGTDQNMGIFSWTSHPMTDFFIEHLGGFLRIEHERPNSIGNGEMVRFSLKFDGFDMKNGEKPSRRISKPGMSADKNAVFWVCLKMRYLKMTIFRWKMMINQ